MLAPSFVLITRAAAIAEDLLKLEEKAIAAAAAAMTDAGLRLAYAASNANHDGTSIRAISTV